MTFEEQLQDSIKSKILSEIKNVEFLDKWKHRNNMIPQDIIEKAWDSIKWDEVVDYVSEQLQLQVCKTIVGNMITETKTDVKKLMSIEGVRERIKVEAYPKLMAIIKDVK